MNAVSPRTFGRTVGYAASAGIMADQSLRYVLLGEAYLMAGRIEHATTTARRALELSRRHEERGIEAWSLRLFGESGQRGDRLETANAEHCYGSARALAQELGMRPLVAHCHCHLGLGELYAKIGKPLEACAELTAAAELYRGMEMTFWLPRAETALAGIAG